jgi:hypothetical protein
MQPQRFHDGSFSLILNPTVESPKRPLASWNRVLEKLLTRYSRNPIHLYNSLRTDPVLRQENPVQTLYFFNNCFNIIVLSALRPPKWYPHWVSLPKCYTWESVRKKRPEPWSDRWILHHDNDPAHDAVKNSRVPGQEIHYKNEPSILFTQLSTLRFLALSEITIFLTGQRFADIPDIADIVTTLLRDIPEDDSQDCFRQWYHRLTKCIASLGEYFEGDSSH